MSQQELMEVIRKKSQQLEVNPDKAMNQIMHCQTAMQSLSELDFDMRDELVELMQAVAKMQGFEDRDDMITDETLEANVDACFDAMQQIRENEHTDDNVGAGKQ